MPLHRLKLLFLSSLTASAVALPAAFAQTAPPRAPVPAGAPLVPGAPLRYGEPPPVPPENSGPRLDFSFERTSLEDAIRRIQGSFHKESGEYLNVMIPEHLREVAQTNTLTLEVKQVTVGELFRLIGLASQRNTRTDFPSGASQNYRLGYTFTLVPTSGKNPTYLLNAEYPPTVAKAFSVGQPEALPFTPPPRDQKFVRFYQLEAFLDRFKIEDITTAVKLGWDLAGMKGQPTMKFHEETKLLVIAGQPEQLRVMEEVLAGLQQALGRPTPGGISRSAPQTGRYGPGAEGIPVVPPIPISPAVPKGLPTTPPKP